MSTVRLPNWSSLRAPPSVFPQRFWFAWHPSHRHETPEIAAWLANWTLQARPSSSSYPLYMFHNHHSIHQHLIPLSPQMWYHQRLLCPFWSPPESENLNFSLPWCFQFTMLHLEKITYNAGEPLNDRTELQTLCCLLKEHFNFIYFQMYL